MTIQLFRAVDTVQLNLSLCLSLPVVSILKQNLLYQAYHHPKQAMCQVSPHLMHSIDHHDLHYRIDVVLSIPKNNIFYK